MLRSARYKYMAFSSGLRPEQLFDMVEDRGETRNLALGDGHRDVLEAHRRLLADWVANTGDQFAVPADAR